MPHNAQAALASVSSRRPRLKTPGKVANRVKKTVAAVERGAKTVLTPSAVAGLAVESVWNAAHLAAYPFGVLAERRREQQAYGTSHLAPEQKALLVGNIEAAGTPILLLHGMIDNRSIFTMLRSGLRKRGFARVLTLNYSPFTSDIREAARIVGEQVEAICEETGHDQIHIVGHSLGGLIARYYVQKLQGYQRVHTLVTMGTPHDGTVVAKIGIGNLVNQLRPGSPIIEDLRTPAPEVTTKFVCYWSDLDHLVLPSRNARIKHDDLTVSNCLVRGVGHMSLPIQPRIVNEITHVLTHLDDTPDNTPMVAQATASPAGRNVAPAV